MPPPWLWNFKVSEGSFPALVPTGGAAGGWEAKCSLMVLWCTGSGALFAVANSEVKTNSVNLLWQEVKMGKHIRWIYSSLFINFVVYSHKICQNDASPSNMSKKGSHCCLWWWRKDHIFSIISAFVTQIHFLPTTEYHIFRNYIQSLKQSISEAEGSCFISDSKFLKNTKITHHIYLM